MFGVSRSLPIRGVEPGHRLLSLRRGTLAEPQSQDVPPRLRPHGIYASTMKTGVPMRTWPNSHSASGMRIRMQPCEAE